MIAVALQRARQIVAPTCRCTPFTPKLVRRPGIVQRARGLDVDRRADAAGRRARAAGLVHLDRARSPPRRGSRSRRRANSRRVVSSRLEAGICRPFSSTRLKSGPTPRTVTREPSPIERSMETPLMRCSDSARLVSGNLPMSSATMPSTTPCESRFSSMEDVRLPRMPVTTTSSSVRSSPAQTQARMRAVPRIKEMACATGVRLNARSFTAIPPLRLRRRCSWRYRNVSALPRRVSAYKFRLAWCIRVGKRSHGHDSRGEGALLKHLSVA